MTGNQGYYSAVVYNAYPEKLKTREMQLSQFSFFHHDLVLDNAGCGNDLRLLLKSALTKDVLGMVRQLCL